MKRGFNAMSRSRARAIQRLGGLTISRNRKYMSRIGRTGGLRKKANHEHSFKLITNKKVFVNWGNANLKDDIRFK